MRDSPVRARMHAWYPPKLSGVCMRDTAHHLSGARKPRYAGKLRFPHSGMSFTERLTET